MRPFAIKLLHLEKVRKRALVFVAGPTCDSTDVMYEKKPYLLPVGLKAGDKIFILGAGAYTASYASGVGLALVLGHCLTDISSFWIDLMLLDAVQLGNLIQG